jgi:hypothetical protein
MNLSVNSSSMGPCLLGIPQAIQREVLFFLKGEEIASVASLLSKDFLRIAQEERLWQKKTIKRFGEAVGKKSHAETGNWKVSFTVLSKLAARIERMEKVKASWQDLRIKKLNAVCRRETE